MNFHSIYEDKEAVRESKNKDSMILNIIGYACRHPNNKNVGITYSYSHRSYPDHQDENLIGKAREAFQLLEF